jgi:membrane associated rhomboid family serine protease
MPGLLKFFPNNDSPHEESQNQVKNTPLQKKMEIILAYIAESAVISGVIGLIAYGANGSWSYAGHVTGISFGAVFAFCIFGWGYMANKEKIDDLFTSALSCGR